MASDADTPSLGRIRTEVARALELFLARQRGTLAAVGDDLLPCLDVMAGLLAGGKRLRPAFCYWGWRAAGGADCPEIYAAAASLELLQASALVHDDVMDASDIRRGQPAVHRHFASLFAAGGPSPAAHRGPAAHRRAAHPSAPGQSGTADQFGVGAAILIGDMLLSWTGELYHASGLSPGILSRGQPALNAMCTEVAAGQYLDLLSQVSRSTSVRAALRVMTYKTAKYTIERPLQLGAALAAAAETSKIADDSSLVSGDRRPSAVIEATAAGIEATCTQYGLPLGIAFQLRDDLLGVFGDPARMGKPVSGDISEGKRTVLMALARERATVSQARVLDRYLGDRELTESGAARVKAVLADTGAVAECEALIGASVKEAVATLDGAPITEEARAALAVLAVTATDRED
jgi:geranylgeranyl diphosphate synthase type I